MKWLVFLSLFVCSKNCGRHLSRDILRAKPITPTYDVMTLPDNTKKASARTTMESHSPIACSANKASTPSLDAPTISGILSKQMERTPMMGLKKVTVTHMLRKVFGNTP